MIEKLVAKLRRIGALAEPARRDLYLYVVAQAEPVSRDQAAAATGLARHVVKFHLDRLVEEGLLEVEFRRLSGRRGPGAGRPAKLYRRAKQEISVSLPERRYELVGRIFADAIRDNATTGQPIGTAVARAAAAAARRIGDEVRAEAGDDPVSLAAILASCGYEPRTEGIRIIMANCPFDALAQHDRELVCGMNLEFVTAMTRALDLDDIEVALDPGTDRCCVTLHQLAK
ncbi:MAG: helix-turn-helix domain-containing protein [Micromonosporaceae bacterium]|nr:helix-turn-helix domain-containing protein [Micromonosporaceae bacterium]